MAAEWVSVFGCGRARRLDAAALGEKGANLAGLARAGVAVPPGFTLTTAAWSEWQRGRGLSGTLKRGIRSAMRAVERRTRLKFGGARRPLLVAVRCGAATAMPGLMPAVLNVGVDDRVLEALAEETSLDLALDCQGRLICSLGEARGIELAAFEEAVENQSDRGAAVKACKRVWQRRTGEPWPDDPWAQLFAAIEAAMGSWDSPIAQAHRRRNPPAVEGVAVTVQAMVFGHASSHCGIGQACTRDVTTGAEGFTGKLTLMAQRAGEGDPVDIIELRPWAKFWRALERAGRAVEKHHRDAADFTFVREGEEVWVLRSRPGRRSGATAARIAMDLAKQGLISIDEAIVRVDARYIEQSLHPALDARAAGPPIATGFGASPGAGCGKLAFDAASATARARAGEAVVLVRTETEPSDIGAMGLCAGIVTSSGGMTSHAAVVARGMGKACVVGAGAMRIDAGGRRVEVNGRALGEADWISMDGARGTIYAGRVPMIEPKLGDAFEQILRWADGRRRMRVLANVDTPRDAAVARKLGAEGIGLCRTEHMFFAPDRIGPMRRMILAEGEAERRAALAELLPLQRADFEGIFREMAGLPVTIRLLDPPLNEFLPRAWQWGEDPHPSPLPQAGEETEGAGEGTEGAGEGTERADEAIARRAEQLLEANPMLGHRGCRLLVSCPEILRMQVRAVIEAACDCAKGGVDVRPRIMIPLVMEARELAYVNDVAREEAEAVMRERGARVAYQLGTMVETPRAALTAGEIAAEAEFFSFGTNDLTQLALGISRDDAAGFLPVYVEKGIFAKDPFAQLDSSGVGMLLRMAVEAGRRERPGLECGVCGEHGGDPASIAACEAMGLDYVSCSPFRVPVARLAAAQAVLRVGS